MRRLRFKPRKTSLNKCGESRTFSATNFAVSSEFTLGNNKFIPLNFCFSIHEQFTHTSSGQEEFNFLITSGARQGSPAVQFGIAMASQFTASEHLNDPGHLFRRNSAGQRLAISSNGAVCLGNQRVPGIAVEDALEGEQGIRSLGRMCAHARTGTRTPILFSPADDVTWPFEDACFATGWHAPSSILLNPSVYIHRFEKRDDESSWTHEITLGDAGDAPKRQSVGAGCLETHLLVFRK